MECTVTGDVTWEHRKHNRLECSRKKPKLSISSKIESASGYWKVTACVFWVVAEGETTLVNACFGTQYPGRQSNATRCDKLIRLSAGGDLDIVILLHKNVTPKEALRRVELQQSFHLKCVGFHTLWRWPCPVGLYLFWWLKQSFWTLPILKQ